MTASTLRTHPATGIRMTPVKGNVLGHQKPVRTGDILAWIVIDPHSGEQIMRCFSRAEAREMQA
jgi:hypothetical protein